MPNKAIEIFGITPQSHWPICPHHYPCTQICETDHLHLPCHKPNIDTILQVCVSVAICSFNIICTPLGRKLIIEGQKQIKVMYATDNPCQSVHTAHFTQSSHPQIAKLTDCQSIDTAHFTIPFCTFILLQDQCEKIVDICTAIEAIIVNPMDCRCLIVSTIIFLCPILKKEHITHHEQCHHHSHKTCKHCDSLLKNSSSSFASNGKFINNNNHYDRK